jgi:hypothetical protein
MSDAPHADEHSIKRIPFTKQDEQTLLTMCNAMRVAAVANVAATLINTFVSIKAGNMGGMVGVLIQAAFAALLFTSATHFQKVAQTDNDDQRHVAEGLDQLRTLFLLKGALVLVGIALVVLVVPIMIFAGGLAAMAAAS